MNAISFYMINQKINQIKRQIVYLNIHLINLI